MNPLRGLHRLEPARLAGLEHRTLLADFNVLPPRAFFDPIRCEPRFIELLRRVGLPAK